MGLKPITRQSFTLRGFEGEARVTLVSLEDEGTEKRSAGVVVETGGRTRKWEIDGRGEILRQVEGPEQGQCTTWPDLHAVLCSYVSADSGSMNQLARAYKSLMGWRNAENENGFPYRFMAEGAVVPEEYQKKYRELVKQMQGAATPERRAAIMDRYRELREELDRSRA